MADENGNTGSTAKRLAWFCGLWVAGVAIIGITAYTIRFLII